MRFVTAFRQFCLNPRVLYIYFAVVLMVPNFFLFCTEPLSAWSRVVYLLLPLSVYMAALTIWRKPGISFWVLFLFLILGAFQLVLLYLFDRSVIAPDMFLNLVTTNSTEAGELLGKLTPAIVGVCVLYLPALTLGLFSMRGEYGLTRRFRLRAVLVAALLGVLSVGAALMARRDDPGFRVCHDIYPANVIYNMGFAAQSWHRTNNYPATSADFTFDARPTHDSTLREVYVLVIGETSRAANWELFGYDRPTNPQLSRVTNLVPLRDALTQSNTTHKSVPMMLSAASAEDFDRIYREKSILTAFREAGFRTVFLSNQRPNRSFIDYFAAEADRYENLRDRLDPNDPNPLDMDLLRLFDDELARGAQKELIVLHTHGSHFNYTERYPDSSRYFTPDRIETIRASEREQLVNAFDNTVRYTDAVLAGIIGRLDSLGAPAVLIYSSDHGEDMLDDARGHFLHSSPIPSYYQMHVPMLLWYSDAYEAAFPDAVATARANAPRPVSTNIVFHTLLGAGGVETPLFDPALSLTDPRFDPRPRTWLGPYNDPLTLDELNLIPSDIDEFRRRGLAFP
ncbi:MAG: lipid A phosphoethanolamine transferase [Rikenellaceae bacterium]|nr:lipid A phosphoethanolamine transferase [Rikenellaceae bacterium]